MRIRANLPNEFGAEKTFAVILENDGVDLRKKVADVVDDLRDLLRR